VIALVYIEPMFVPMPNADGTLTVRLTASFCLINANDVAETITGDKGELLLKAESVETAVKHNDNAATIKNRFNQLIRKRYTGVEVVWFIDAKGVL